MCSRCEWAITACLLAAALVVPGCREGGEGSRSLGDSRAEPEGSGTASYVGREACAGCHAGEDALWSGSDHDLAMQEATETTVLGDFDGASYAHFGVTSTFFRRGDAFVVRTDGPDGRLQDFEIAYTFGARPLQQYLVAFPGGRYQALSLAWDSRPASSGGQRWFHLYPDEPIPFTDNLHWTRLNQNWNHMCAGCHSVNVKKGYDAATRSFNTTWSEVDVACEACHGPGSRHVEWARTGRPMPAGKGERPSSPRDRAASGDRQEPAENSDASRASSRTVSATADLETSDPASSVVHATMAGPSPPALSLEAAGIIRGDTAASGVGSSGTESPGPRVGLTVDFGGGGPAVWAFDPVTGIAKRNPPLAARTELNACAPCHSRRSTLAEGVLPDQPLTSGYRPSLLEEDLYHADGQILGEVYEYGSFLQSRMHAAGVACSDCHDPHSLKLNAEPDAVCARCHLPSRFDAPDHHHHEAGSEGASCVACHMPARTYMVVDPRRDHSFRVPRPDLTVRIGAPNACNSCHGDRPATWAAAAVSGWGPRALGEAASGRTAPDAGVGSGSGRGGEVMSGEARRGAPKLRGEESRTEGRAGPPAGPGRGGSNHYAEAIHAGREGLPHAERSLAGLVEDTSQPGIARATALSLLGARIGPSSLPVVESALSDGDPLVRMAALEALDISGSPDALRIGTPLLEDSALAVRIQAGRSIAGLPRESMTPGQQEALRRALADYRAAQELNADRPEAQLNLAWLHAAQGDHSAAEKASLEAIFLDPDFIPAYVNLADLYRLMERDADGERVLGEGLARAPETASLHHALGLNLVRRKRLAEAIGSLKRAADLAPGEPRFAYVLGVALHEAGRTSDAMVVLEKAHERHPGDRSILEALVAFNRQAGRIAESLRFARALALLSPGDPGIRELIRQLESMQRR